MKTKTCGECRFYNPDYILCLHWRHEDITAKSEVCNYFKPLTNGDRIRRYSNDELANHCRKPLCLSCIHAEHPNDDCVRCGAPSAVDCIEGYLAWLNAPAESERKDED